jgi:integrase/recombinase XerD
MPAALTLATEGVDLVATYCTDMHTAGRKTGRSTLLAARSFCAKLERAGGWDGMNRRQKVDALRKARYFASWMMVTGRLQVSAELFTDLELRLGVTARAFLPAMFTGFQESCVLAGATPADVKLQWNAVAKIAAISGTPVDKVDDEQFNAASSAVIDAYRARGMPESGRAAAAVFHRLRLSLFHAGQLADFRKPPSRTPVSVAGWDRVPTGLTENARRYVGQIALSLRPSTVRHTEHSLRELAGWLADNAPEVLTWADLNRHHIEAYKQWLVTTPRPSTGKPLNPVSRKNRLIDLHCFFDRTAEWGYPGAPVRPLVFVGDLPVVDKPLPRFLDDPAAAKLLRAARADGDPLARLVTELLARTGLRLGELLRLTVDAVVQIGSAYWLRVPIGKLHNDRYVPLHPQLKEMLDDWVDNHRPQGLRLERLLVERGRPVTAFRVRHILASQAQAAGVAHVTPHQLRHTLATQAINRGMSLDAIAALLGHKTLAMTMVYARIADKTVAQEYFSVTEKVEALYDQPRQLAAGDEGQEMRKLRSEMHRRMLGNGYCARPVEMDCHFESICESCTFFVTTVEFRPTLERQRDDAANKGQVGRQKIFDGLIARLDSEAS